MVPKGFGGMDIIENNSMGAEIVCLGAGVVVGN